MILNLFWFLFSAEDFVPSDEDMDFVSDEESTSAKKARRKTESDEDFVMESSSNGEEDASDSDWEEEVQISIL